MQEIVRFENITYQYGTKTILKNVDFIVSSGEIMGLLGPSGAGKTTILKIITGQLQPVKGKSSVFGMPSSKIGKQRADIGMLMEDSGFYERLSVFDNLWIFAQIYNLKKDAVYDALRQVGLEGHHTKKAKDLSKGMCQRLLLARAILHQPKMLFLDEPTSGLDPSSANKIHEVILKLQKKGTTLFLTTHNMQEATKLCNRIILLHKGRIVEKGTVQAICSRHNDTQRIEVGLAGGEREILNLEDKETERKLCRYLNSKLVVTMHTLEPTLEEVFIKHTGVRWE